MCFCGGYSNRVKRLIRLSGNFILLKASLFSKGLLFRARPSQSGLSSVSLAMWRGVGRYFDIRPGFKASKGSGKGTKARRKMADNVANVDIIKCAALFCKLGAAPKDFIRKENFA